MKERVNESFSPIKSGQEVTAFTAKSGILKRDASSGLGASSKKIPTIKDKIQELSGGYIGRTLDMSSVSAKSKPESEGGKKRFDELLNSYFAALPTALTTTMSSPAKPEPKSNKKTLMDAFKTGFATKAQNGHKANAIETVQKKPLYSGQVGEGLITTKAYTTAGSGTGFISAVSTLVYPQSARNATTPGIKQPLKDELKKLQAYIDKMSTEEYLTLTPNFKEDLTKLAQSIMFKQKVAQMSAKAIHNY